MCCESLPRLLLELQFFYTDRCPCMRDLRFVRGVQASRKKRKEEELPSNISISAVALPSWQSQAAFTSPPRILPVSIDTSMLARPGEARQKSTPNTQRRKKVTSEDPNDTVRRLQRLPPNKACADCTSKPAQCVNLNHGTFVCMACSGVQ